MGKTEHFYTGEVSTFISGLTAAASTIHRVYYNWQKQQKYILAENRYDLTFDTRTKSLINKLVLQVSSAIGFITTAQIANGDHMAAEKQKAYLNSLAIPYRDTNRPAEMKKAEIEAGVGSCHGLAVYAYMHIQHCAKIPIQVKQALKIVRLYNPGDHVFTLG